ncbi:MAG TPA: hypothetical protein VLB87_15955, partial [Pyrinomonadaceae bacterium]|nr:hypothetical protein [Pyrinomonadaceae bacterium]
MKKTRICSLLLLLLIFGGAARASDVSDVRSMVQNVFEQLKARNYSGLYDVLPGAARNRLS